MFWKALGGGVRGVEMKPIPIKLHQLSYSRRFQGPSLFTQIIHFACVSQALYKLRVFRLGDGRHKYVYYMYWFNTKRIKYKTPGSPFESNHTYLKPFLCTRKTAPSLTKLSVDHLGRALQHKVLQITICWFLYST